MSDRSGKSFPPSFIRSSLSRANPNVFGVVSPITTPRADCAQDAPLLVDARLKRLDLATLFPSFRYFRQKRIGDRPVAVSTINVSTNLFRECQMPSVGESVIAD